MSNKPFSENGIYELPEPYALQVTEGRLELVVSKKSGTSRLSAEFLKGTAGYRRQQGGGKNQAIARAVGLKTYKEKPTVLDATAGFGRDAFVLASLGCSIQLVERSPIIAALLLNGLERASSSPLLLPIVQRMKVTVADAKEVLQNLNKKNCPDVVYLDPMFPAKNKSALAKLEMRVIRDIVGDDSDADRLLFLALEKGKKRVVVKRPQQAPALTPERPPNFVIKGKSSRYDVYLTENF